jgi:O-antigen/teichoic acid export membrane protein
MAAGAAWMVLAKLVERSLGIVSTLILARLLVPADFGLVAVAMAVVAVLELLTGFGFDIALIRDQKATREHYDTAWTLNLLVGMAIALLMLALALPAARFFSDERLTWILVVLALMPLLTGLENIGVVAFRKELDFRREFIFLSGKKLVMFFTAVPLAAMLGNYWALVAGMTVGRLAATALSYWMHPYRPRWSLARVADLLGFSKWMFLMNIVMFFKLRFADFVIGRMAGPGALGLFNVGSEIASLPTSELVAPINRAVFPGYSTMGGDITALRRAYLSVTGVVALVALPAGATIAAMAPILVPLMLGPKWLETIPVIQIVAFFGMTTALLSNSFSIFLALGLPKVPTLLGAAQVLVLFAALPFGVSQAGIVGAAWATLAVGVAVLPVNFHLLMRLVKCPLGELLSWLWRPLLATAALFVALDACVSRLRPTSLVELLVANAAAGAGAVLGYLACAALLWVLAGRPEGAESLLLARVKAARAGSSQG